MPPAEFRETKPSAADRSGVLDRQFVLPVPEMWQQEVRVTEVLAGRPTPKAS